MTLQTLYALIYDKTLLERLPPSIFYRKIKTNTSVRNSSFFVLFDGPKTQIRPIQRSIFPLLKHSLSRHTHIHKKKRKKPNVRTICLVIWFYGSQVRVLRHVSGISNSLAFRILYYTLYLQKIEFTQKQTISTATRLHTDQ